MIQPPQLRPLTRAADGSIKTQRRADRLRDALQADENGKQRDERLEQINKRQAARLAGMFENAP